MDDNFSLNVIITTDTMGKDFVACILLGYMPNFILKFFTWGHRTNNSNVIYFVFVLIWVSQCNWKEIWHCGFRSPNAFDDNIYGYFGYTVIA